MNISDFGKKLKSARVEKNISQRGLGLALGLSDKTISSYESSRSYPNLELLPKLSQILDKPVEFFVSNSKEIELFDKFETILEKQKEISDELLKIQDMIKKVE